MLTECSSWTSEGVAGCNACAIDRGGSPLSSSGRDMALASRTSYQVVVLRLMVGHDAIAPWSVRAIRR